MKAKLVITTLLISSIGVILCGCMKDKDKLLEKKAFEEQQLGIARQDEQPPFPIATILPTNTPIIATPEPSLAPVVTQEPPQATLEPQVEVAKPQPLPTANLAPIPTATPIPQVKFTGSAPQIADIAPEDLVLPASDAPRMDALKPSFVKLNVASLDFTNNTATFKYSGTEITTTINNTLASAVYATINIGIFKNGKQVATQELYKGELEARTSLDVSTFFEKSDFVSDQYEIKYLGKMRTLEE